MLRIQMSIVDLSGLPGLRKSIERRLVPQEAYALSLHVQEAWRDDDDCVLFVFSLKKD